MRSDVFYYYTHSSIEYKPRYVLIQHVQNKTSKAALQLLSSQQT